MQCFERIINMNFYNNLFIDNPDEVASRVGLVKARAHAHEVFSQDEIQQMEVKL